MPQNRPLPLPRVALVFARDPGVPHGGTDIRVAALVEGLRKVARVEDVLAVERDQVGARRGRVVDRLVAAGHGVPPRLSQQYDRRVAGGVQAALNAADVIVAATTFSLPYVPGHLMERVVLDAHNVESKVVEQLARHDPRRGRRLAFAVTRSWTDRWERRAASRVAQVWAVSEEEAAWFREAGATDVVVVPNGVRIRDTQTSRAGTAVVFVASFGSVFNRQALEWFLRAVWPRVVGQVPTAQLVVAGRGSEAYGGEGIDARGFVTDLDEVYGTARVAVAPLRSGAGTRLKVLEGLAQRVPVVATTLGAEGLDLVPGQDYLRADAPEDFAAAVIRLLTDDELHSRTVEHGTSAVARRYSWTTIAEGAVRELLRLSPP